MRLLVLATLATLSLAGCSLAPKYVEGTNFSLGAYVPVDGQLMGVEVCNYLSGCKVAATTNQPFFVQREFAATNSYFWGMVKTIESTRTSVDVK